jgi:Tfp pilus assembly protein PilN
MIRINLLTEARGAKKAGGIPGPRPVAMGGGGEGAPLWPAYIAILALFVLAVCAYGAWLLMRNHALAVQIAEQKVELKKYEGARERVAELEQKKIEYTSKLDQIKQLKEQQSVPVKLMNRLMEVLPEGAWYTSVKQAGSGIGVEGKAKSIKTISTLYDNLVATTEFGNVMLGDVAQQAAAGQEEIYSYKVTFSYFPGGVKPQAAPEAPAAKAPRPRAKKAASESAE